MFYRRDKGFCLISMLYELHMLHAFKCEIMIIMTNSNLQITEIFISLILNFVNIWIWTTIAGKDSNAYKSSLISHGKCPLGSFWHSEVDKCVYCGINWFVMTWNTPNWRHLKICRLLYKKRIKPSSSTCFWQYNKEVAFLT